MFQINWTYPFKYSQTLGGSLGGGVGASTNADMLLTGFEEGAPLACTINFDNVTKVFTLGHVSRYNVWIGGVRYTYSSDQTVDISASIAEGMWYFYINSIGVLSASQVFPGIGNEVALVSFMYWDNTNGKYLSLHDERHTVIMDSATHTYLHVSIGSRWRNGMDAHHDAENTVSAPTDDTKSRMWITDGTLLDEDLSYSIANSATPSSDFEQILGSGLTSATAAKLPVMYLDGGAGGSDILWRKWDNDSDRFAFYHDGIAGSRPYYNKYDSGTSDWSIAEIDSGKFIAYWIVATNSVDEPIRLVMGQEQHDTIEEAEEYNTINSIVWGDFPFPEIKILYRVIYASRANYTSATHRTKIRKVSDFRNVYSTPSVDFVATSHSSLSDLDYSNSGHTDFNSVYGLKQRALNNTGGGIAQYKCVKISGFNLVNQLSEVTVITATSDPVLGVVEDPAFSDGDASNLVTYGPMESTLDCSTSAVGNSVYASATGDLTLTNTGLQVGTVLTATANGWIFVNTIK